MSASVLSGPCPVSGRPGHRVKVITLKALLRPQALARLQPGGAFQFCPDPSCDVVYFGADQMFRVSDLKVPVAQKNSGDRVPLCFCFGLTRAEVWAAGKEGRGADLLDTIRGHIRAGRCGCEVNNPQGRCCLGGISAQLAST